MHPSALSATKVPAKSSHKSGVKSNSQVVILPQTSLIAFLGANDEVHSKENQTSETLENAKYDLLERGEKVNLSEDFWSGAGQLQLEENSLEDFKPLPVAETVDLSQVQGSVYLAGIREFRWPKHLDAPNFHTMGWRRSAGQVSKFCHVFSKLSCLTLYCLGSLCLPYHGQPVHVQGTEDEAC